MESLPRRVRDATRELSAIFQREPDRRRAHAVAAPLLAQLTRDSSFLTGVLEHHLRTADFFAKENYPVVALPIVRTSELELVANCWIPLPDRRTDLSTKAIHHHGKLLLSTATLFGPGYEHWTFAKPEPIDPARDLFRMRPIEQAQHARGQVAFVDAWIAHVPMYPRDTTVTLALWTNSTTIGWRDHLKQVPVVQRNKELIRGVARRLGLTRQLDINVVEYFDFDPTPHGFHGQRERREFDLGPIADHLHSLLHVVQVTGNAQLGAIVRERLERTAEIEPAVRKLAGNLLDDLRAERPIEGKLSSGHYDLPFANFTADDIRRAVAAQDLSTKNREPIDARQFAS